jgi:LysM repeat protein
MSGSTPGALLVAALLWAMPASALQARDDPASVHTVVGGDTLWSLAEHFYGDADLWVLLYEANRVSVPGPDRLRPGQVIRIPSPPVEPSGSASEGGGARLATIAVGQGGSAPVVDASAPIPTRREVGAEDPAPGLAAASESGARDRPGIPLSVIAGAPFILSRDEVEGLTDSIAPSGTRVARPGDRVRLALRSGRFEPGLRMHSFLVGRALDGGAGVVAIPTALLRLEAVSDGSSTAVVESVFGRVAPGDRVLPIPSGRDVPPGSIPVSSGLEIKVLGSAAGKPILRPGDWVFLDTGLSGGIALGDEFVPAWMADAERQPGRLQVVRVDASHATARIVRLGGSSFEPGRIVRLDRRRR